MSKFQLAVLIIFGLCIVGGIMAFSVYRGSGATTTDLSIWGTVPTDSWNSWYGTSPIYQDRLYRITYTYIPEANFDQELVNAIAEGRGPDIVFTFHDRILKNQAKLLPIPFSSFSLRDYLSTFIDGSTVLTSSTGEWGVPLVVDPLVLYFNKDIFVNYSLVQAPQIWEQMYSLAQGMTIRDKNTGNIIQATIPLGAYNNVLHAKEILSTLIMQAGGALVQDSNNYISATLNESFGLSYSPANAALLFFTEFSNPAKIFYTWNRSLPDSLTEFAAGDSAMFIGFASDYQKIRDKNSNLAFDVSFLPQSSTAKRAITYGRMLSLAVTKGSTKSTPAFGAIFEMMSAQSVQNLANVLRLPPVRRDLLKTRPSDPFIAVFYDSAIQSVAWKDPDTEKTNIIFQNMIDSVISGRARVEDATRNAHDELKKLIDSLTPQLPATQ
ncbi:MAG: extracellular solute-binding protein [Minisyncoccia bacterium]